MNGMFGIKIFFDGFSRDFISLHPVLIHLGGVAPYGNIYFDVGIHRIPLHYILCCYISGRCPFGYLVI